MSTEEKSALVKRLSALNKQIEEGLKKHKQTAEALAAKRAAKTPSRLTPRKRVTRTPSAGPTVSPAMTAEQRQKAKKDALDRELDQITGAEASGSAQDGGDDVAKELEKAEKEVRGVAWRGALPSPVSGSPALTGAGLGAARRQRQCCQPWAEPEPVAWAGSR